MGKHKATDVPNYLYYDDRNVLGVLADYLASLPDIHTPWTIRVTSRNPRENTEKELYKEGIANSSTEGLLPLLGKIETAITNELGPVPDCSIRVRAWTKGHAERAPVNISQRITPPSEIGERHGVELYRWVIDRMARHQDHAQNILLQTNAQYAGLLADTHEQLARTSTQRAVGTTMADSSGTGGLMQILTVGALVAGWPAIKKALNIDPSATNADVLTMAQARLLQVQKDFQLDGAGPPAPPPGSYEEPAEPEEIYDPEEIDDPEKIDDPAAPALIAGPAVVDIAAILAQVKADPALLLDFGTAIKADPFFKPLIEN